MRSALLLALASILVASTLVRSQVTAEEFPRMVKEGYVFTRALVLGPHGQPIYAEFDASGNVIDVIGEATDEGSPKLGGAVVMPGAAYVAQRTGFENLKGADQHAQSDFNHDFEVLTAADYVARAYDSVVVADPQAGKPDQLSRVSVIKPVLSGGTRSVVLLRPQAMRTKQDAQNPLRLQSPIDLTSISTAVNAASVAVLLDSGGKVVRVAQPPVVNIGYRAAYWYKPNTVSTPGAGGFNNQLTSPVYAEVDHGKVVGVINLSVEQMAGTRVLSAAVYKSYQAAYQVVQSGAPAGVEVYSAQAYAAKNFGSVTLPDPQPNKPTQTMTVTIVKASLGEGMNSVVVRSKNAIKSRGDATDGFVLLQTPLDPAGLTGAAPGGRNLLLDAGGKVFKFSEHDIVYQPAFSNPGVPVLSDINSGIDNDASLLNDPHDLPWGPLEGAPVYSTLPQPNGITNIAPTDEQGHYVLEYLLPQCPGFFMEFNPFLMAEIRFTDFNPRRRGGMVSYIAAREMADICNGEANGPLDTFLVGQVVQERQKEIALNTPDPPHRFDLPVDIIALSGRGRVRNPDGTGVKIGSGSPEYDYPEPDQGVTATTAGRLADALPDFANRGLLKALSPDDLRDHTDLYLYRVSNGQLLSQRQGLPSQPAYTDGGVAADNSQAQKICDEADIACFYFMMAARGSYNWDYLAGRVESFQQATQVPKELQGLHADHLRPGETVKIIAVNRSTGYIGAATLSASNLAQLSHLQQLNLLPEIVMGPPNLKIWAERTHRVRAGFTSSATSKTNMVGSEGASLIDDEKVIIYSQWLDRDGSSLPPDLPGYTGRFARAVGGNALVEAGSEAVAHFEIKPGLRTQVIDLKDIESAASQYYIHVSGASRDSSPGPDFSPGAQGQPNLRYRPARYVPFLVPVSDEASTRALANTAIGEQRRVTATLEFGALVLKAASTADEALAAADAVNATEAEAGAFVQQVRSLAEAAKVLKDPAYALVGAALTTINHQHTGDEAEALGKVFELMPKVRALERQAATVRDIVRPAPGTQGLLPVAQTLAGQLLASLDFADIVEGGGAADARLILDHADWRNVQSQYGWYYRPEYQISRLKLDLQNLEITTDYYQGPRDHGEVPPPRNQTEIDLSYVLYGGASGPLPGFNLPAELVLALGYLESAANVTTNQDTQVLHNQDLEDALRQAMGGSQQEALEVLAALSATDFTALQLYANNDPGNSLLEYAGVPPIMTQTRRLDMTRTAITPVFDVKPGAAVTAVETDGYEVIEFSLLEKSKVTVRLLDDKKAAVRTLIEAPTEPLPVGAHRIALAYVDVVGKAGDPTGIKPIRGADYYVEIEAKSDDAIDGGFKKFTHKVRFPGELTPDRDGRMLGQNVVHDVLIQDGSLTLSRGDFGFPGLGPALALVRSYSNQNNRVDGVLGQGWSHSLDIRLTAQGFGKADEGGAEYNLPQWIADGRKKFDPRKPEGKNEFTLISVSNGGVFKKRIEGGKQRWYPQRGNHGQLEETTSDFTFTSKDGTQYNFPLPMTPRGDDPCAAASAITTDANSYSPETSNIASVLADFISLRAGVLPEFLLLRKPLPAPPRSQLVNWIEDRHHNRMSFSYRRELDEQANKDRIKVCRGASPVYNDLLVDVTDAVHRTLHFSYETKGKASRITRIDGPDKTELVYDYDVRKLPPEQGSGDTEPREVALLKSATRNKAATEKYQYVQEVEHDAFNLSTVTDPRNYDTTYTYAGPGQINPNIALDVNSEDVVLNLEYPDRASIKYEYPDKFHRKVIDAMEHRTTYTLNDVGNPSVIAEDGGRLTNLTWSEQDDVLLAKEINGHKWAYAYDANGNVESEIDPMRFETKSHWTNKFNLLARREDRAGNVRQYFYDAEGNLVEEVDGNDKHVFHAEYTNGLRGATVDARRTTTHFEYDEYGVLNKIKRPLGSNTGYENDIRGRRKSMTDPNGNVWKYNYDELDRLISEKDPDNRSTTYQYDAKGNKIQEVTRLGLKLVSTYDPRDRVVDIERSSADHVAGHQHFDYSPDGDLIGETDWKGQATTHEYDALNHRIKTTDRKQQDWAYAVDVWGNLTSETAPNGRISVTAYDDDDRRVSLIEKISLAEGDQRETKWSYDDEGHVTHVSDAENRETVTEYDGEYRVKKVTENGPTPDGGSATRITKYELDENGNRLSVIDPNQHQTSTEFDDLNRPFAVHAPEGRELAYVYDLNGNLTDESKPNGARHYEYDKENHRIFARMADSGEWNYTYDAEGHQTAVTDPNGYVTRTQYDSAGRVVLQRAADDGVTNFEYDENGNRKNLIDARRAGTSWDYDELDRVIEQRAPEKRKTTYAYDELGNRTLLTDPRGIQTISHYDLVSRLTDQIEGKKDDDPEATQRTHSTIYDKTNHVIRQTDGRGVITLTNYDAFYRAIRTEQASGTPEARVTTAEYDPVGNLHSATDANHHSSVYTYDGLNRLTDTQNPDDTHVARIYDAQNLKSQVNEDGQHTTFDYDGEDRLATLTNNDNETVTTHYDGAGNVIGKDLPKGNSWTYHYDPVNRLKGIDTPGGSTQYSYDPNGNLLSTSDGNHHETGYDYDHANRKIKVIQPPMAGGSALATKYVYDLDDNQIEVTDPSGQVFSYAYDTLNRLTKSIAPAKHGAYPTGAITVATTYDENNNLLTADRTQDGVTDHNIYVYDKLNRQTHQNQRNNSVARTYDAQGNVTSVIGTTAATYNAYDTRNRLKAVSPSPIPSDASNTAAASVVYAYTPDSKLDTLTYKNGATMHYGYDLANRISQIRHQAHGATLDQFDYSYDDNGNRLTEDETAPGKNRHASYGYDDADRLTHTEESPSPGGQGQGLKTVDYTLDDAGNRTKERTSEDIWITNATPKLITRSTRQDYAYDALNRITGISLIDLDHRDLLLRGMAIDQQDYAYDKNGNLTSVTHSNDEDQRIYAYDSKDQLVWAGKKAQPTQQTPEPPTITLGQYGYDDRGMRTRHSGARGAIETVYDGTRILEEHGSQNNSYLQGIGLVAIESQQGTQYVHQDALRSTRTLTDEGGSISASYTLNAWGGIEASTGSSNSTQVFTGKEHDDETGLEYFNHRYLDTKSGRFITQDSLIGRPDDPSSLNRYLYANANPLMYVDSTGHYNEGGHFYTDYYIGLQVMKALGADERNAYVVASFSQLPDQLSTSDATNVAMHVVKADAPQEILDASQHMEGTQSSGHTLGGLTAVQKELARRAAMKATDYPTFGNALHPFADSTPHSVEGQEYLPDYIKRQFDTGVGHAEVTTTLGREHDFIHLRLAEYEHSVRERTALMFEWMCQQQHQCYPPFMREAVIEETTARLLGAVKQSLTQRCFSHGPRTCDDSEINEHTISKIRALDAAANGGAPLDSPEAASRGATAYGDPVEEELKNIQDSVKKDHPTWGSGSEELENEVKNILNSKLGGRGYSQGDLEAVSSKQLAQQVVSIHLGAMHQKLNSDTEEYGGAVASVYGNVAYAQLHVHQRSEYITLEPINPSSGPLPPR